VARTRPADRFTHLISAAAEIFIAQGYQRTQMQDVADRLSVAEGTVYGYVESKAALLGAALRYADGLELPPDELPLPTPADGENCLPHNHTSTSWRSDSGQDAAFNTSPSTPVESPGSRSPTRCSPPNGAMPTRSARDESNCPAATAQPCCWRRTPLDGALAVHSHDRAWIQILDMPVLDPQTGRSALIGYAGHDAACLPRSSGRKLGTTGMSRSGLTARHL
jgi:hypothetical protein